MQLKSPRGAVRGRGEACDILTPTPSIALAHGAWFPCHAQSQHLAPAVRSAQARMLARGQLSPVLHSALLCGSQPDPGFPSPLGEKDGGGREGRPDAMGTRGFPKSLQQRHRIWHSGQSQQRGWQGLRWVAGLGLSLPRGERPIALPRLLGKTVLSPPPPLSPLQTPATRAPFVCNPLAAALCPLSL